MSTCLPQNDQKNKTKKKLKERGMSSLLSSSAKDRKATSLWTFACHKQTNKTT
jgi:hypothetical protein